MPDPAKLARATLTEVTLGDGDTPTEATGTPIKVQFNPESLKVVYSNTFEGGENPGSAAMQFVSRASTKLDVELWFDASYDAGTSDVRTFTDEVQYFIRPKEARTDDGDKFVVPAVRFQWGSFLFDGVVSTMNETLDFFSSDGRPLRARLGVGISNQDIKFRIPPPTAGDGGPTTPGQAPQTPVAQGDTMQQAAARSGNPSDWQSLADANGIDNPRQPAPGTFLSPATGR